MTPAGFELTSCDYQADALSTVLSRLMNYTLVLYVRNIIRIYKWCVVRVNSNKSTNISVLLPNMFGVLLASTNAIAMISIQQISCI